MPTAGGASAVNAACVVALPGSRADLARIAAALRPMAVRAVTTADELKRVVLSEGLRCAAVIAVARDADGVTVSAALEAIAAVLPHLPIFGYCGTGAHEGEALRELAQAGVHELVFREVDDMPGVLRAKLKEGEEACAAAAVLAAVHLILPPALQPIAKYVVRFPRESHSVVRVAATLSVHRKTLTNWCTRAHAPRPSAVITWCRLLLAAELLQSPGRSIERISNELEFASSSAFRNLCKRYIGLTPTELRDERALRQAYEAFARAFAWSGRSGAARIARGPGGPGRAARPLFTRR